MAAGISSRSLLGTAHDMLRCYRARLKPFGGSRPGLWACLVARARNRSVSSRLAAHEAARTTSLCNGKLPFRPGATRPTGLASCARHINNEHTWIQACPVHGFQRSHGFAADPPSGAIVPFPN